MTTGTSTENSNTILVRGAREHNLQNITVELPRNRFIVVTGISGSGKSSLAFDTLYAEGQRRYVESLSAYARQFLERLEKPDVDHIEGIAPAIAIEQRSAGSNPRSTVGTTTEIHDYLRLLYARVGHPHCPECGEPIKRQTAQEIVQQIQALGAGERVNILAPLVRGRKGEYRKLLTQAKQQGYVRVRVDGTLRDLGEHIAIDARRAHNIEVVVDRLVLKKGITSRLTDSVETALQTGLGTVVVAGEPTSTTSGKAAKQPQELVFSERYACVLCGTSMTELEPRMFSFNSPYGACEECSGLGTQPEFDPDLIVPDPSRSLRQGAIAAWRRGGKRLILRYRSMLRSLARSRGFDTDTPFRKLSKSVRELVLYGDERFEGVVPNLERRLLQTESDFVKRDIGRFMSVLACAACDGARLRPQSLAVTVDGEGIADVNQMSIRRAREYFDGLTLTSTEHIIAAEALKEIRLRLRFLSDVGLDYLTLDRVAGTLSGGEAQRIRLATQIGAGLVGVLYILDEPSIGLHQRDNERLLTTLHALRDLGNTLVVVEHDEATIRAADHVIDLGPGAGRHGGRVVASGQLRDILESSESVTGQFLRGERSIPVSPQRRPWRGKPFLWIRGAREHNLQNIDVGFPVGLFTCVTGVSGSGKSTLVDNILFRALAQHFHGGRDKPGVFRRLENLEEIDKVVVIDQSPIGRTPRSNAVTYTGTFTFIRQLFSRTPEARMRGYRPGRFSFNVKGGRCEACRGDGVTRIEMHFLPDVYVECDVCHGRRFNDETLKVRYKGRSIADILALTVSEALEVFRPVPAIRRRLETLRDVGLGYLQLGQQATTLSGGEAQRIKLATELAKVATGRTLYILDEPTTGLHFADIECLLQVLHVLVDAGNTVVVIEHNLDVIKTADYIIDLGPEGGDEGGCIVAKGSPDEVMRVQKSYTGQYLQPMLQ